MNDVLTIGIITIMMLNHLRRIRDNYGLESSAAGLNDDDHPDPYGQPDTDSDHDVYGQRLAYPFSVRNFEEGEQTKHMHHTSP